MRPGNSRAASVSDFRTVPMSFSEALSSNGTG